MLSGFYAFSVAACVSDDTSMLPMVPVEGISMNCALKGLM